MIPGSVQYLDAAGNFLLPQHPADGFRVPCVGEMVSQQGVLQNYRVTGVATVLRVAGVVDYVTYMVTLAPM